MHGGGSGAQWYRYRLSLDNGGGTTMSDEPLWRMPDRYTIVMHLDYQRGWKLSIDTGYEGMRWTEDTRDRYEGLSLTEAVDALLGTIYGG